MVKEISGKKTLSLGAAVDVAKIVEQKERRSRGSVIEIKGKPISNVATPKVVEKTILKNTSHVVTEVSTKTSVTSGGLTKEEILNRSKVLDRAEDDDKPVVISKVATIEVVQKESVIPLVEEEVVLSEPVVEEAVVVNAPIVNPSFKKVVRTSSVKSSKDDGEEKPETNKAKKSIAGEQLKKPLGNNWRNLDVALIEEPDVDDMGEEDALPSEVYVQAVVRKPFYTKRKHKFKNSKQKQYVDIEIKDEISVLDLARALQEKVRILMKSLSNMGMSVTETTMLDVTTAEIVATELGHTATVIESESIEDALTRFDDVDGKLAKRAPVVAIMGHVDHGKTSLLDTLRKTNVVKGEAGGITQHIGAYQIKTPSGELITFLDTPGHEAFGAIRSRGSKVTDIILLVVAADDGLKPQTIEAIEHAQKANVPLIVVVNKIDKEAKNVMKIKTDLLQHNVVVEEMGGDVLVVEVSATAKIGLDKLLEAILLQAEVLDLKTVYNGRSKGNIIEVKVQKGLGILATVLLERGTLKLSDNFVCGTKTGKVKMIMDDAGNRLKSAPPYLPIEISGFNDVVKAGDSFIVVNTEQEANQIAQYRLDKLNKKTNIVAKFDLQNLLSKNIDQSQTLSVVVRTDTQGSLDAITTSLEAITHPEIKIKVAVGGVGEITESDINFAKTSKAIIFGFNSRANAKARDLAKVNNIEIRYHSIIYKIIDDAKMIMSGMLDPEIVENIIGYATVKEVFNISKLGNIAGSEVTEGVIRKSAFVRLLRNNVVVYNDILSQLKHFKDNVKEVKSGSTCGIALSNYHDIVVGDVIECYEKTSNKKIVK